MKKTKVAHVDIFNGPMGAYGFRTGYWTATTEDGKKFRFFYSLPHREGLNKERLIKAAEATLERGRIEWI